MKLIFALFVSLLWMAGNSFATITDAETARLIDGLRSPDANERVKIADRVSQMDDLPDALMPVLFDLVLTKPKGGMREQAVGSVAIHFGNLSLAKMGKRAVPRLRELMKNVDTRWNAVGILNRIGPESVDAVPELIIALGDSNENVRSLAVYTLKYLGSRATPAVDALIPLLKDPNESVQDRAIEVLGMIGAPAAKALPELKKLLKPEYTSTAMRAAEAIEKIEVTK
jgi:HEAT repeat protein